jgi:hypothetical protein
VSISNTDICTFCHGWWLRCFPLYLIEDARIIRHSTEVPITLATWSNVWFCDYSLAGNAGSNPAGAMDVCLL